MKKYVCYLLLILFLVGTLSSTAYADENAENPGEYTFEITIERDSSFLDVNTRSIVTKQSKTYTYKHNGEALWKVTLTGWFQYNGVTSTCLDSSCSTTVYASGWSCSSKTSYELNNQAIGDATMVKKFLGITIDSQSVHLTLVCDKDGNVY